MSKIHNERRAAAYMKRGLGIKAQFAKVSGNRSKRARGKVRQSVNWQWRGNRFAQARKEMGL